MSTTWTRTRAQIGADVLFKLRVIAYGDTPEANSLLAVNDALDYKLKELHAIGLLPWKLTTAPVDVAIRAPTNIITGTSWLASVATFKSTAHGLIVGQSVTIASVISSSTTYSYNGTFIVATSADANTFTVAMVNNPGTWTSGGTAVGSVITGITDMLYPVTFNISSAGIDYPVAIISNAGYQAIPDKSSPGMPDTCYFDGSTIYLSPQPDKAYTGKLTYQKIIDDSSASAPDVPVTAMRCIVDMLAGILCDGLVIDDARYTVMKQEAAAAEIRLRKLIYHPQTITTQTADYF